MTQRKMNGASFKLDLLHALSFGAVALLACGAPRVSTAATPASRDCTQQPFSERSAWNAPIERGASMHTENEQLVGQIAHTGTRFGLNLRPWGIPVFSAEHSSPRMAFQVTDIAGSGFAAGTEIPLPRDIRADPEFDGHVAIVDSDACFEWDCWQFRMHEGTPTCSVAAAIDLTGSGVRVPFDEATGSEAHGARACGFPLLAGLIRLEEVQRGHIDHALVFAYPGIRAIQFVMPASTGHPLFVRISADEGLPCGARIRLDPDLDLDALSLSPFARMVAEALQRYGAYVGDYSGSLSFYAESAPQAMTAWQSQGVDTHALEGIPLARLQVLAWDALRVGR